MFKVVTCIELIGQSTGRDPKVTKIVLRWAELLQYTFTPLLSLTHSEFSWLGEVLSDVVLMAINFSKFVVFHCGYFE